MKNPSWINNIKVLIWDLDGTLYQDKPGLQKNFKKILYQKLAALWQVSFKEAKERFEKRQKNLKGITLSLVSFGLNGYQLIEEVMKEVKFESFLKKDPRLKKMFKDLSRFDHFLLTDNTKESASRKLKLLGLNTSFFKKIFYCLDLQITKPDIRLFKIVLDNISLPAKSCLLIGDSLGKDIAPAKKVGMRTCLVWGKSKVADISLPQVYDIVKLFQ